jgi:LPXTG-motif cell wall-anchored protein
MSSDSENILYLILGLGLAAALSAIIMLVQKRKARGSWQGVVGWPARCGIPA